MGEAKKGPLCKYCARSLGTEGALCGCPAETAARERQRIMAFLRKAINHQQDIKRLEEQRRDLKEKATITGNQLKGRVTVQGGKKNPAEERMAEYANKVAEIEAEIMQTSNRLEDTKTEIRKKINAMPEGNKRDLLRWRYVALVRWDQICQGIADWPITDRWQRQLHNDAIRQFHRANKEYFADENNT